MLLFSNFPKNFAQKTMLLRKIYPVNLYIWQQNVTAIKNILPFQALSWTVVTITLREKNKDITTRGDFFRLHSTLEFSLISRSSVDMYKNYWIILYVECIADFTVSGSWSRWSVISVWRLQESAPTKEKLTK